MIHKLSPRLDDQGANPDMIFQILQHRVKTPQTCLVNLDYLLKDLRQAQNVDSLHNNLYIPFELSHYRCRMDLQDNIC
jgi:hypothetical protein